MLSVHPAFFLNRMRIVLLSGLILLFFADGQLAMHREFISNAILAAMAFGASLLALFGLKGAFREITILRPFVFMLTAFLWLVIISYLQGPWYDSAFDLMRYGGLLLLIFLVLNTAREHLPFSFLQDCFLLVLGLAGLLVALSVLFGLNWGYADLDPHNGLGFTIANRNHFGAALLILLFTGAPRVLSVTSRIGRILSATAVVSGLVLCLLSGSRAVLLMLAFGFAVFGLYGLINGWSQLKRQRWLLPLVFGSGALLLVAAASLVGPEVKEKLLTLGQNKSDFGRLSIWPAVWQMVWDVPIAAVFGHGAGYLYEQVFVYPTEGLNFQLRLDGFAHAHNEYLDLLLEGGVLVFGLLAFVAFRIFRSVFRSVVSTPIEVSENPVDPDLSRLDYFGILVALVSAAGFAAVSVAFRYSIALMPLALVVAFIFRDAGFAYFRVRGWKCGLTLCSLLLVSLGSLVFFGHQLRADHYYLKYTQSANLWLKLHGSNLVELEPIEKAVLQREQALAVDAPTAQAALKTRAAYYMNRGLEINPRHVRLRFKYHERAVADRENFSEEEVQEAFEAVDALVPNVAGLWSNHAEFLASVGRLDEAVELARKEAKRDFYNLAKELDVLFYESIRNNQQGMQASAAKIIEKAALAEIQRKNPAIMKVRNRGDLVTIHFRNKESPRGRSIMDLDVSVFLQQVFNQPRMTKHAFRQSLVGTLVGVYATHFEIDDPVFLENFEVRRL